MLTGTPELYASTFTMRTHQDRYITYNFLAVVYGTHFHKLLTHLDFFTWLIFLSAKAVYSNSYTNKASTIITVTTIKASTIITVTTIITFYVYTFTRDTRAHARAYLCRLYICTPTLHTYIHTCTRCTPSNTFSPLTPKRQVVCRCPSKEFENLSISNIFE